MTPTIRRIKEETTRIPAKEPGIHETEVRTRTLVEIRKCCSDMYLYHSTPYGNKPVPREWKFCPYCQALIEEVAP